MLNTTILILIYCNFHVINGVYALIVGQNSAWYAKDWPPQKKKTYNKVTLNLQIHKIIRHVNYFK